MLVYWMAEIQNGILLVRDTGSAPLPTTSPGLSQMGFSAVSYSSSDLTEQLCSVSGLCVLTKLTSIASYLSHRESEEGAGPR